MTSINGFTNAPPYNNNSLPVNVVVDGNGTVRLCASLGIPKEGEVTNFKNIYATGTGATQTIYTAPGGKTFYVMALMFSTTNLSTQSAVHWAVQDSLGNTVQQGDLFTSTTTPTPNPTTAAFPIAIIQQGYSIVLTAIGAYNFTNFSINFIGYEEWGATN